MPETHHPPVNIGDQVAFRGKTGEPLGELTIDENRYGGWCGKFTPASGYSGVRELFVEWTTLVNDQCFLALDAVDDKIASLGVLVFLEGESIQICDVQIHDEGDQIHGSFRLVT